MTVTILSASATPGNENDAVLTFQKQFVGADNVKWTKSEDGFQRVAFTWNSRRMEAYFDRDGEFAGAVRGLFYDQMPLIVIRSIERNFKKPLVLEVREITNTEGTFYSLLMEIKGKKYRVKVDIGGGILDQERVKK